MLSGIHSAQMALKWSYSVVSNSVTLWTVACYVPLSMRFSRQEYQSGLPCPDPGILSDPGIKPAPSVTMHCRQILYHWATREFIKMLHSKVCVCVCVCVCVLISEKTAMWKGQKQPSWFHNYFEETVEYALKKKKKRPYKVAFLWVCMTWGHFAP